MNKEKFLDALRRRLSGLPQEDIDERIAFYEEMIDDRMDEGVSEEEAVSRIGSVEEIARQIMSEIPLQKLVKEKISPKRSLKAWEIILLVLGSPVWIPLIIAAIAVLLALYVVLWAVVICFYAVDVSFVAGTLACIVGLFVSLMVGNLVVALFSLGAGLAFAGLTILMFFVCKGITKAVIKLTGWMLLRIKISFVGRED